MPEGAVSLTDVQARDISFTENIDNKIIVERLTYIIQDSQPATGSTYEDHDQQILNHGITRYFKKLHELVRANEDDHKYRPYKNLLTYELRDSDIFYGRSDSIKDFIDKLKSRNLTVLHAASGSGKSSLIQAGIQPQLLASGHLPVILRRYNPDPIQAIKKSLLMAEPLSPNLDILTLRDFLHKVTGIFQENRCLYIFLDQFETLFTQVNERDRKQFLEAWAECLEDATLLVSWIVSVRDDYLPAVSGLDPTIPNSMANAYALKTLSRTEAREVITAPLMNQKIRFEESLIDKILNDLGEDDLIPAYLQLVCDNLYDSLSNGQRIITYDLYRENGHAEGIIQGYLQRFLNKQLNSDERKIASPILEALVTSDGKRVLLSQDELVSYGHHLEFAEDDVHKTLIKMVNGRVLQREDIAQIGASYELVHDLLVSQIYLRPEVVARKEAEELLSNGVIGWDRHEITLSSQHLKIIEAQKDIIYLHEAGLKLLVRSAAKNKRKPRQWINNFSDNARQRLISESIEMPLSRKQAWEIYLLWLLRAYLPTSLRYRVIQRYITRQILRGAFILGAIIILTVIVINLLELILVPLETDWNEVPIIAASSSTTLVPAWLAIDIGEPETVYISDLSQGAIYVGIDDGSEWNKVTDLPSSDIAAQFEVAQEKFYILTSEGLYIKGGENQWQRNTALEAHRDGQSLQAIAVGGADPNIILVGIAEKGLYRSVNVHQEWELIPEVEGETFYALGIRSNYVIAVTDRGIWESGSAGDEWHLLEEAGSVGNGGVENIVDVAFPSPNSPDRYFLLFRQGLIQDSNIGSNVYNRGNLPELPENTRAIDADISDAIYVITDEVLYCWRRWTWTQEPWWLAKLGGDVPCIGMKNNN